MTDVETWVAASRGPGPAPGPTPEGTYMAWYIPQVPMEPFKYHCSTLAEARVVLDALTGLSAFEYAKRVKPDYSDAGGIVVMERGLWEDVEDEDL